MVNKPAFTVFVLFFIFSNHLGAAEEVAVVIVNKLLISVALIVFYTKTTRTHCLPV